MYISLRFVPSWFFISHYDSMAFNDGVAYARPTPVYQLMMALFIGAFMCYSAPNS